MQNNFYAYALALFSLDQEPTQVFEFLKQWYSIHCDFPLLVKYLSNKYGIKFQQHELVNEIGNILHLPSYLLHWLWVIIDDGVYFSFVNIFKECKKRFCILTKTISVHITSAFVLTKDQKQQIMSKLQTITSSNIDLEVDIDSSLIDGLQINFLNKIYDNSIKNKLSFLKNKLMEDKE